MLKTKKEFIIFSKNQTEIANLSTMLSQCNLTFTPRLSTILSQF